MQLMPKCSLLSLTAVLTAALFLALIAVPIARADATDPTIYVYSSPTATNDSPYSGGTETTDSWLYPGSGVAAAGATTYISFLNDTGTNWLSVTIVATMDSTSDHIFSCDPNTLTPATKYGTQAFSSCTAASPITSSTTETFTFTGGSIDAGDYLVFVWNNFPTNSGDGPLNFDFTASPTPEPGSMLLFGSGLLILGGWLSYRKKRLPESRTAA